jgi:hypothetical protein
MIHNSILLGIVTLILLLGSGCSRVIDPIVVPINNATLDLNRTKMNLAMPLDLFPGAEVHLKGNKLAIEKNF